MPLLLYLTPPNCVQVALGSGVHVGEYVLAKIAVADAQRLREDQYRAHQLPFLYLAFLLFPTASVLHPIDQSIYRVLPVAGMGHKQPCRLGTLHLSIKEMGSGIRTPVHICDPTTASCGLHTVMHSRDVYILRCTVVTCVL
eukprot:647823-Pelagomonas_calceolata.AAC.1